MTSPDQTALGEPTSDAAAPPSARGAAATWANRALAAANGVGAVLYVYRASFGWRDPSDSAAGVDSLTAEPIIWGLAILPVVATFLVVNLAWAGTALVLHGRPRGGYWLAVGVVWAAALAVDFAHH